MIIQILILGSMFLEPSEAYCDNLYHTNETKFLMICNQEETTKRILKTKRGY